MPWKDAHLQVDIDKQFMWKAEMNTGQCDDGFFDTKLSSTVLMKQSCTHVGILTSLTETSHLMVLCQLVVDLHDSTELTASQVSHLKIPLPIWQKQ